MRRRLFAGGPGQWPANGSAVPRLAIGKRIYGDRDYVFRKVPQELLGLPRIAAAVEKAKSDSALRLEARVPVRIYVAFAKKGFSESWLDPQPGWQFYCEGGLESTIVQIGQGMDIYYQDFGPGKLRLFEGKRGAYVLLGIQPKSSPGERTSVCCRRGDAVAWRTLRRTDRAPERRLVHLVNYREGLAFRDVAVTVRFPPESTPPQWHSPVRNIRRTSRCGTINTATAFTSTCRRLASTRLPSSLSVSEGRRRRRTS